MLSGIIQRICQATKYTSVSVILNVFYFRVIVVIRFLVPSTGNIKYNFIVFYKEYIVETEFGKILSSCLEIIFKPVFFKEKMFLWLCWLTFKFKYIYFFFFFFEAVSVSQTIFCIILTVWKNNLYSRLICWIYFLTWPGIKWETLNSCLSFNRKTFGN